MNDVQYLITNHCFAFVIVSLNISFNYARINLICERILLSKSLLRLLLNSLLNDNSQQTLNFIRHLLSNF